MARFIMANRRAGLFTHGEKLRSREALNESFEARISRVSNTISDHAGPNETSRRTILVEGDSQEIESLRKTVPSEVLIEPEILHYSAIALPLDLAYMQQAKRKRALKIGEGSQMSIKIRGSGQEVEGAEVRLFLRGSFQLSNELVSYTDQNGNVEFNYSSFWSPAALVISPVGGFWRKIVRGPRDGQTIYLRRLPQGSYTSWWHRLHGINAFDVKRGNGVRVGVIDTGLGPHPNLAHANVQGAYIDGQFDPDGGADVDSHGTHVAGIIGARPNNQGEYAGLAPGVDLYTVRVFPPGQGANQGDIVNAIDHLSIVNSCDLINLSLGGSVGSDIEHDAIIDAIERGTLCICAAANDGIQPIDFPARFEETVGISAIGLEGWGPDGSISSLNYPAEFEKFGYDNYYLASFSNFGPDLSGAGGGVGIISTVPERYGYVGPYAVMDGTSMASPAACGALAAYLSRNQDYLAMPRDITRAQRANDMFRAGARDLGLDSIYQGVGSPQAI